MKTILAILMTLIAAASCQEDSISSVPMELRQQEYQRFLQTTDGGTTDSTAVEDSNGPWDKCLGMQAEDCVEYIESLASDVFCVVVYPGVGGTNFNYDRIWIRVNSRGQVARTPARG